jgi:glycosyltransferase involved in cell wall biosynthesis
MESVEQPLISVIIPCYNYGKFLKDCIGSLLAQTYSNWECIIVDDGSTDNSKEEAKELVAKDSRINYFLQSNSGPAAARNLGLSVAKGSLIQFLDADDLIENRKFEKQTAVLNRHPDCDIVYSGVQYFASANPSKLFDSLDLKSGPWMKNSSGSGELMIKELLNGNIMVINSPLIRRSLFEKYGSFNNALHFNEDWELWARFAIGNAEFYFDGSSDTHALVRVHESYSKDVFKMYVYGLKASLMLNEKVHGRQFKKIMIPKIKYHERMLDEKLLSILSVNKIEAVSRALQVYDLTKVSRYLIYSKLFNYFPFWFCYLYSKFIVSINKLKNVIIYA